MSRREKMRTHMYGAIEYANYAANWYSEKGVGKKEHEGMDIFGYHYNKKKRR